MRCARTRRRSPRYALDRLIDAGATVFGPKDASSRGGAVSFWYKDVHPHDLATILNEEGVAIRAGHHCAQLVMRRFDTPATARASFYVYNTKEEVDVLVESLAKAEAIFISLAAEGTWRSTTCTRKSSSTTTRTRGTSTSCRRPS